ncbi:LacI family DNA-binding transcriptional regulator [Georgenia alba]|uniref:LacI family DNA-binding transcriptional regulator n=1 Tax=Georgenia alba TaxID=2233858 RepID=A0ABW2Q8E9_9MICO
MDPAEPSGAARRVATRSDVARRAGVSTAVVSYVVNNGPRPVAAATRERVLAAMRDLDYRPNAVARALRMQRAHAVGLVVPDISNTYFGTLARVLSDRAFSAGYAMLLGDSHSDLERERAQIESLVTHRVDGLIVVSLEPGSTADVGTTPVVYLDQRTSKGQASVVVDNADGARQAVHHLAEHARRRIGHLAGPEGAPGTAARRSGWQEAALAAGLPADDDLVVHAPFSRDGGLVAGRELLQRSPRPDAVFVASDVQATGLLLAARELGIAVPDELAVISFDGTEETVFSDPPLTSVRQPVDRIVETALAMVLGESPPDEARSIPVQLVVRRSCGCDQTTQRIPDDATAGQAASSAADG